MKSQNFFLLLPVLIKLFLAATLELSVDESHYLNYGNWAALSYFDHPPMVGWVQFVFSYFPFGNWIARLPSILIGAYLFWDIYQWLCRRYENPQLAIWIVTGLQFSPILFAMTFLFLPETPLLLFSWLVFRRIEALEIPSPVRILEVAFWCGLAGLSKYTAVLLLPGLLWQFLQRKWYRVEGFWGGSIAGVGLGLALISPVLIWNYQNDWISFSYQTDHVLQTAFSLNNFATSVAGVFIGYSIFLVPWIFVLGFRPLNETDRWALRLTLPVALFFAYAGLTEPILPHWPALVFLVGLAVAQAKAWSLYPGARVWIRRSVSAAVLMTIFLLSQFYFPLPGMEMASRDISGWGDTQARIEVLLKDPKNNSIQGLITTHWTITSRAVVYFKSLLPVHLVDDRKDQYDFWLTSPEHHKDYFVLYSSLEERELKTLVKCGELSLVEEIPARVNGREIFRYQLWLCRKYLPAAEFK